MHLFIMLRPPTVIRRHFFLEYFNILMWNLYFYSKIAIKQSPIHTHIHTLTYLLTYAKKNKKNCESNQHLHMLYPKPQHWLQTLFVRVKRKKNKNVCICIIFSASSCFSLLILINIYSNKKSLKARIVYLIWIANTFLVCLEKKKQKTKQINWQNC